MAHQPFTVLLPEAQITATRSLHLAKSFVKDSHTTLGTSAIVSVFREGLGSFQNLRELRSSVRQVFLRGKLEKALSLRVAFCGPELSQASSFSCRKRDGRLFLRLGEPSDRPRHLRRSLDLQFGPLFYILLLHTEELAIVLFRAREAFRRVFGGLKPQTLLSRSRKSLLVQSGELQDLNPLRERLSKGLLVFLTSVGLRNKRITGTLPKGWWAFFAFFAVLIGKKPALRWCAAADFESIGCHPKPVQKP